MFQVSGSIKKIIYNSSERFGRRHLIPVLSLWGSTSASTQSFSTPAKIKGQGRPMPLRKTVLRKYLSNYMKYKHVSSADSLETDKNNKYKIDSYI